jgi:ATP-dependent Lon protease
VTSLGRSIAPDGRKFVRVRSAACGRSHPGHRRTYIGALRQGSSIDEEGGSKPGLLDEVDRSSGGDPSSALLGSTRAEHHGPH